MKNSRIQIKKPGNQNKKSEFWFLSCEPYSQANRQKIIQEIAKKPNLKNWQGIKNLQSLVGQRVSQETKKPKSIRKFSQILESVRPISAYPHRSFPRIQPHPPPLHGGYKIPSMDGMEVTFLRLTNLNFYQQQTQKI